MRNTPCKPQNLSAYEILFEQAPKTGICFLHDFQLSLTHGNLTDYVVQINALKHYIQ